MEEECLRNNPDWKEWGPYLSERQWGTVREDTSLDGNCWDDFSHSQAVHRAYRWGEDGLLGITDKQCSLCLSVALWNGNDPMLKERLYGLTNPQGNHGEDVKELYYYLDSTPTHSYMKALYKYPQREFPYKKLEYENGLRTIFDREYELLDTGIFNDKRYFDVVAEYCKASPTYVLGRYTITNHGPERAVVHVLPTLWFRNVWSWGNCDAAMDGKPVLYQDSDGRVLCQHPILGQLGERKSIPVDENRPADSEATPRDASGSSTSSAKRKRESPPLESQTAKKRKVEVEGVYAFEVDVDQNGDLPTILFTENDTNYEKTKDSKRKNYSRYTKDSFHQYVTQGNHGVINKSGGTKCAAHYICTLEPGQKAVLKIQFYKTTEQTPSSRFSTKWFDKMFEQRIHEANEFYNKVIPYSDPVHRQIARQAYAGLLWSKQFYYLIQREWSLQRKMANKLLEKMYTERNLDWQQLYNKDIIAMPDKWEFPWYAAWDLCLQMIPFANVDAQFAMSQLELLLQEGYLHPDGRIPAFEFSFGDTNPPLHTYAVLKVFRKSKDTGFLKRCFEKLLVNFNWWRKNNVIGGLNLYTGGFLGFDNISVFDRSNPPLKADYCLAQADATAWMAMYCLNMLDVSLILAKEETQQSDKYQDMAVNFLNHFLEISEDINKETGLWNTEDGFFCDAVIGKDEPLKPRQIKIRSMVGLVSLFGSSLLRESDLKSLPKVYTWMMENQDRLSDRMSCSIPDEREILLSLLNKEKLLQILGHVLDEDKFLSPYGIRSLSKEYQAQPYDLRYEQWSDCLVTHIESEPDLEPEPKAKGSAVKILYSIKYEPGESQTVLFGGNSNWRGPVWLPVNYLLIEGLRCFSDFYKEDLKVEFPTGSGEYIFLKDVAKELSRRLIKLFVPDTEGKRPCHGSDSIYATDPEFKNLCLFYEYFHGDTGRGCGASHQTGWTALIVNLLDNLIHS